MMLRTSFTTLMGIRFPIVSAPMAGTAGAALAHAVSSAGGLGMIGGGYATDRKWLETQLTLMKEMTSRTPVRYGIGFITHFLQRNDIQQFQMALDAKPNVMFFTAGDASSYAARCHDKGVLVISQVNTLKDAQEAAKYSDVIVVQGNESGGHGQTCRSLTSFVPAAVDLLSPHIPVLAAGACSDGRGLAAALGLGASGVVMGTRFCCTPESLLADSMKEAMLKATGDDTIRSPAIDLVRGPEWPLPYDGRLISNALTERWRDQSSQLYDPSTRSRERALYQEHVRTRGNLAAPVVWCGEGIDSVHEIISASQIVTQTVTQAIEIIHRLALSTITPEIANSISSSSSNNSNSNSNSNSKSISPTPSSTSSSSRSNGPRSAL